MVKSPVDCKDSLAFTSVLGPTIDATMFYQAMKSLTFVLMSTMLIHCASSSCAGGRCSQMSATYEQKKENHALVGHTIKAFPLSTVFHCHLTCFHEEPCRCLAVQINIQEKRCELLDEDRFTAPKDFKPTHGVDYYDMHQQYTQSVPQGQVPCSDVTCSNGCCAYAPCLNGGTCTELCDDIKHKLNCTCMPGYTGKMCEKKARSCKDFLLTPGTASGKYTLFDSNEQTYQVFCDFSLEENQLVWTVIESFALKNNANFASKAFFMDHPLNEQKFTWDEYRLSLDHMTELAARSTQFRATCNYNTDGFNLNDHIRANLSEIPLLTFNSGVACKNYEYLNIRGMSCVKCNAPFIQNSVYHAQIDSSFDYGCDVDQWEGAVYDEDNFGGYGITNIKHRCTANQDSTTQWWFGESAD